MYCECGGVHVVCVHVVCVCVRVCTRVCTRVCVHASFFVIEYFLYIKNNRKSSNGTMALCAAGNIPLQWIVYNNDNTTSLTMSFSQFNPSIPPPSYFSPLC